jgi:hypothetical protein
VRVASQASNASALANLRTAGGASAAARPVRRAPRLVVDQVDDGHAEGWGIQGVAMGSIGQGEARAGAPGVPGGQQRRQREAELGAAGAAAGVARARQILEVQRAAVLFDHRAAQAQAQAHAFGCGW